MNMIVCQDIDFIYLFNINVEQKKIVFCTKIKASNSAVVDVMKQSSLLYDSKKDQLYNVYKSPLDYHQQILLLHKDEEKDIIGINCFNEFLKLSDFHSFTSQFYPQIDSQTLFDNIIFYSKRLKIVINDDPITNEWVIYYLDSQEQLNFEKVDARDNIVKSIIFKKKYMDKKGKEI